MTSPPNPAIEPTVTYEYLFFLPLSNRLRQPLDGRLRGYYQGFVPQVPRVTGYGPKNLVMTGSHQQQMARDPYTP
jgi:hypothetical protein